MTSFWTDLAARADLELTSSQTDNLSRYLDLLVEANRRLNLTRITDRAAAEILHVGDALTLLPHLPTGAIWLADVGSGGGVPGIPLAIVRPDARVLLIESTKKKANFLREVVRQLGLTNAEVTDARAEAIGRSNRRESFDVAAARAVGSLVWLAEWCLPLLRTGGKLLAMKGERIKDELPEALKPLRKLGGGEPMVHPVELPGTEHHVIVEVPKIGKTDLKYPRDPTSTRGKPMA